MNISSQIFHTNVANCSDCFFNNVTGEDTWFSTVSVVNIIVILLGFPLNSYVIWLIVTGAGNGLTAEFFILNLSICEIFFCLEFVLFFVISQCKFLLNVMYFLDGLAIAGRFFFQCLMCVERYLAVVHPVTFLKYKPLRYRVICSVIVWLTGVICGSINVGIFNILPTYLDFILVLTQFLIFFSIQLFCLVAVLRALKQSGPGDRKRDEENHMKRRAFYLILVITVTLFVSFSSYMITSILLFLLGSVHLPLLVCFYFFIISGWVQPLFILSRVKKPPFIKC